MDDTVNLRIVDRGWRLHPDLYRWSDDNDTIRVVHDRMTYNKFAWINHKFIHHSYLFTKPSCANITGFRIKRFPVKWQDIKRFNIFWWHRCTLLGKCSACHLLSSLFTCLHNSCGTLTNCALQLHTLSYRSCTFYCEIKIVYVFMQDYGKKLHFL